MERKESVDIKHRCGHVSTYEPAEAVRLENDLCRRCSPSGIFCSKPSCKEIGLIRQDGLNWCDAHKSEAVVKPENLAGTLVKSPIGPPAPWFCKTCEKEITVAKTHHFCDATWRAPAAAAALGEPAWPGVAPGAAAMRTNPLHGGLQSQPPAEVKYECGHTQVHPFSGFFKPGDTAIGPCDACRPGWAIGKPSRRDEAGACASGPSDDAEAIQAAFLAAQAKHGFTSAGLSAPEPPPTPNAHPAVWSLVLKDMIDRDQTGRAKYGTPLQPHNGRRFLVDLYQELLDAAVYVRGRIYEEDGK